MYTIATLHALRRHLGLATADIAEDARLMEALRAASAQIEREARRHFLPWQAALAHAPAACRNELLLNDDLLDLTAVEDGSGAVPLDEVDRLPTDGIASVLRLRNGRCFTPDEGQVTVTGVWGWHDDWQHAWLSSHDGVADDPLESTATVISVDDADGEDGGLNAPRFQVGQVIAINQEWMRIVRLDTSSNSLSVYRAVAGTHIAAHGQFSPINIFQPARDVSDLTVRWAAWLYKQSSPVPAEFHQVLRPFRRDRVQS